MALLYTPLKIGLLIKQQISSDVFTVASDLCNLIFLLTTKSDALITKCTSTEEFNWWEEEHQVQTIIYKQIIIITIIIKMN